ncbi:MAG: Smr/MutS family protein [Gallionella sp.]|nr:Smr/MutS family protein [Gallionella sp.]
MKKSCENNICKIAPGDAALFRAAIGEVKPLAEQNRITPKPAPRKPLLRSPIPPPAIPDTWSDGCPARSFSDSADGDAPDEFLGNGLSRMALRKLRRGSQPVQDRLDLHGLHTGTARKLLQEFLHEAAQRNLRCVLVIHGKGINSPGGEAVLRKLTRHWLTRHPGVMGYCDAPPKEGGSGAVMILLKAGKGEGHLY